MSPFSLLHHILQHPLNKKQKVKALLRFGRWQATTFLNSSYATIYPFTERAKLIVAKGMTGATQNIYCGFSDYEDMFFLLHFLRREDCFADIGANVGSYTVLAGAHVGARVIAFEPIPSTHRQLIANIKINNIESHVSALNLGLGAMKGILSFTQAFDTKNRIAQANDENVIMVPVETFDEVIKEDIPALIKIDVEGFETEVLKGAVQTLRNQALKAIIIELNGSGNRYGYNEDDIHNNLLSFGFQPYAYEPKKRSLQALSTYGSANTIYLRDKCFIEERLQSAEKVSIFNEAI